MYLTLRTCLLVNLQELRYRRLSTEGPLCSCCLVVSELKLVWQFVVGQGCRTRASVWNTVMMFFWCLVHSKRDGYLTLLCSCCSVLMLLYCFCSAVRNVNDTTSTTNGLTVPWQFVFSTCSSIPTSCTAVPANVAYMTTCIMHKPTENSPHPIW